MESVLCLGYKPQSIISLRIPSTTSSATNPWNAKLNFSYNHSSLWHFASCKRRQLDHILNPMPQGNYDEKGDNRIVIGAAAASLVLACAITCFCGCKMSPKAIAGPKQVYQKAPPVNEMEPIFPVGGKLALQSLLDVSAYLASSKVLPEPYNLKGFNFDSLPDSPSKEEVEAIKMEAVRLMKYGKPEEALELLYKACRKYNYKDVPESAYYAEMALIEILICQGKFEEALKCQCLRDDQGQPSDVQLTLYKAIIYTMRDKDEDDAKAAKLWWKVFRRTIGEGINPSSN